MSQPSKSISEQVEEFDLSFDTLREVYHVPVLAALFAFMLWVRTRGWENFVNGEEVLFSGNDAYYHYRMVQYTTNNWPATMPFDPWTSFPTGTSVGQFGTLFDQLIATGALVYGLGSPTEFQVKLVTLFAPAVLGALAIIPTFYIGKRLGGKAGGLIAALILALTPGQFLTRSVVGFADHHVGETLFMAIAVVLIMAALAVAERDRPIWELFTARDFDALRPTLLWSTLAGVGIGLYVWVWPPGVFLAGIVAVFLVLYLLGSFVRGGVPDHVGIPGAVMMTAATVMVLIPLDTFAFSATRFSIAQPFVTAGAALACAAIVGGSRLWERQDSLPRAAFPAALVVAGLAVVGLVAVALPDVFGFFVTQLTRVAGFGATVTAQTVAEATPVQNPSQFVYTAYGLAFYTAVGGLVLLAYRTLQSDTIDPVGTFVIVWTLFLLAATFTQRRFDYYFILAVAGLNAFLAKEVFGMIGLYDLAGDVREIEGYQVLSILAVLLIITAPLAVRPAGGSLNNVVDQAEGQTASPGEVANWESGLRWLDSETPQEGQWGSNPESALGDDKYATYEKTENFDYGSGDYGVLAWWDYGHWITVLGDRVPNANPFQQNADYAANVLLSTNESYAYEQMERTQGEDERTRYVMLDYQMGLAGTRKFSAPSAWETRYTIDNATGEGYAGQPPANASVHDLQPRDLSTNVFVAQQVQGQLRPVSRYAVQSQRSMESFRTRLYQYHGSRAEPTFRDGSVVVADWENQQFRGRGLRVATAETQLVRTFPNMTAAEDYVRQDPTSQIGGVLGKPSEPVPAMEHYRLVWASERSAATPVSRAFRIQQRLRGQQAGNIETQPYLKTFERVPGATVTGEAAPNTTVTATAQMRIPTNGQTFTYQQQAETGPDGEFTMTVPYSTTGYDQWGPEQGHTNVSVRATGPYAFTTPRTVNQSTLAVEQYTGSANVTEAQVIGADESTVEVEMRKLTISEPEGAGNDTNETSTNSTDTSGDTNGTETTNDTSTTPTPTPTGESTPTPTPTPSQSLAPLASVAEPDTLAADVLRFGGALGVLG